LRRAEKHATTNDQSLRALHLDIQTGIELITDPLRHKNWEDDAGNFVSTLINCCCLEAKMYLGEVIEYLLP